MYSCEENIPLPPRKTKLQRARALTTIYGASLARTKRKKPRTSTDDSRIMIENDSIPRPGLSPFRPLPAIGVAATDAARMRADRDAKLLLLDIGRTESADDSAVKIRDVLEPLRISGYYSRRTRVLEPKPQLLLRENTYDLIEPIFLSAPKVKKRDSSVSRRTLTPQVPSPSSEPSGESDDNSPRSRFRRAALEARKLSSVPETGRLLRLRGRVTARLDDDGQPAPVSPAQRLNKLSEIFQSLDVKGRHRDKMKKENNWF